MVALIASNILKLSAFCFACFVVDGGYSNWNSWSDCSVSCGGGRKARSRSCNNPAPQHGGKDCSSLGPSLETTACNTNGCPGKCSLYP